jgi:hypothetical protein
MVEIKYPNLKIDDYIFLGFKPRLSDGRFGFFGLVDGLSLGKENSVLEAGLFGFQLVAIDHGFSTSCVVYGQDEADYGNGHLRKYLEKDAKLINKEGIYVFNGEDNRNCDVAIISGFFGDVIREIEKASYPIRNSKLLKLHDILR